MFNEHSILNIVLSGVLCTSAAASDRQWAEYLGGGGREHYSPLEQIDRSNVTDLQVAWEYSTGVLGEMQCNPLIVEGRLFGVTARGDVFAVDAATGEELWKSHDEAEMSPEDAQRRRTLRGVMYWESGDDKRIVYSRDEWLCALDAETGRVVAGFGDSGRVSLKVGLGSDAQEKWVVSTTPGTLFGDLLIMPLRTSEGGGAAPGFIQAFDVRSGALIWTFRTIPGEGEFGRETWPGDFQLSAKIGGANSWAGMAIDKERGLLFVPTGSAAPDFWGGARKGSNLFANCLLALDARTGERVWHYQFVHHDLWDRDLPAPPSLVTVKREGIAIDAVAQVTKTGYVYVFDRETGEPLFPIEERAVPESSMAGESAWPTQPVPPKPVPFARQGLTERDLSPFAENREELLAQFRAARKGAFQPFGLEPTVLFPGFDGGAEWGGAAVDPNGILYVNANEMAWMARLIETPKRDELSTLSPGQRVYAQYCVACHGGERLGNPASRVPSLVELNQRMKLEEVVGIVKGGRGMMPGFGAIAQSDQRAVAEFLLGSEKTEGPSGFDSAREEAPDVNPPYKLKGYVKFLDSKGHPAISPPWGTLTAIDLNSGEHLWRVPLGDVEAFSTETGEPTGTENYGGPVVTAGGLVFIAATKDGKFRAFDKDSGALLWETELPAAGFATPSVYEVDGRQYVAVAAGGTKIGTKKGDSYVAYALPAKPDKGQSKVATKALPDWQPLSYPKSEHILGVEFEVVTRRTKAVGSDIWPITWSDDGHQYTAFGDGGGFGGDNKLGRVSLGVSRIEGESENYVGKNVWGGADAENAAQFEGKGTGILSVGGVLYMWVAGPASKTVGTARLAVSRDHSKSWELADWQWTMEDKLFAGAFVNAGEDYVSAPDGYVYTCFTRLNEVPDAPRAWTHERPGSIDLARVPKDRILDESAWEWFAGETAGGALRWSRAREARQSIFEDPNGIKVVSVCYQPELQRYLLTYNPRDSNGHFAMFESETLWGDWKEVAYLKQFPLFVPPEESWRVATYHFAPKWWSEDGKGFTLVFNVGDDSWNTVRGHFKLAEEN